MIIDAHVHLWDVQNGAIAAGPVYSIGNGRSNFAGEIRQMMPPYILDGRNTVEMLISNMDFAGVNGAVVVQEVMDGNQDAYYLKAKEKFPKRIKICSLYEEDSGKLPQTEGFDGIKICAARLKDQNLMHHEAAFSLAAEHGKFLCIELTEGDSQVKALDTLAGKYPTLKIAVGHFGMAGREKWMEQIKLAHHENVSIESGGITWLYNDEFWPYSGAVKAFREAIDEVGADKIMWGSDYPRTMSAITYRMSLDFLMFCDDNIITPEEKKLVLGENAMKFYGFDEMEPIERIHHMAE